MNMVNGRTTPEHWIFITDEDITIPKQESPPAWTQEAYRPRRIKYSICYLRWGTPLAGGVPPGQVSWEGTRGGIPPPVGVPPGYVWWRGTRGEVPLAGHPPSQVWQGDTQGGVPPFWPGLMGVPEVRYPIPRRVTSSQVWWGYPRWGTPSRVTSQPGLTGGYPRWGIPPLARSDGGYLRWGTPHWIWLGYPPSWTCPGYTPPPHLARWGTPLADLAGVPPPWTDRWMDGWMDGQTHVKTLPSHRTTHTTPECLLQHLVIITARNIVAVADKL